MSLGKKLASTLIGLTLLIMISIILKMDTRSEVRLNEKIIVDKKSSLYELLKVQLEEKMILKEKTQILYDTQR